MAPDIAASARAGDADLDLRADCASCVGLCCVEPAFVASAEFALTKPAGTPCPNLLADCRCAIHDSLREQGFGGCATFDCFGAGQRLTARFGNRDWRSHPATAKHMFDAFPTLRGLSELLWHLREAHQLAPTAALAGRAAQLHDDIAVHADARAEDLAVLDVAPLRHRVGALLDEVSTAIRASVPSRGSDRRHADLSGADLRKARLAGVSLRGAVLIGADLSGADLRRADLLGADLRGARVHGTRLAEALFLTQPQLDAARGDAATRVPRRLRRPRHWPSSG